MVVSHPLARLLTDGVLPAQCPSRVVLDHVTSKWGVLVLVALSAETLRWGELHRVVEGISEKMLAQTLRVLVADGFVALLRERFDFESDLPHLTVFGTCFQPEGESS